MPVVARARQSRRCPRPSSRRLHARQSLPRQRHRAALRPGGTATNARLGGGAGSASPPRAPPRRVAFAPRRPLWPRFSLHTCFPHFFPASPGEAMAASDAGRHPQNDDYRTLSLSAHVGFDSLPDQLIKKSIKQGFSFNVLCIGETGIGKSALINSLFNSNFEDPPSTHFLPRVQLRTQTYELQESDVLLKLTIVNTVGFGDQMNKRDSYQPVVDYIDAQFEAYLQEELKIIRSLFSYHDTRIHVCLYFISPTGRSLKTLDLLTMRSLDSKGNLPFAVVGSMEKVNIGDKMVRARQYPWGIVKVENESHCDTVKLRKMLCTNMEDLREKTHAQHYELYRRCRLEEMGFRDIDPETKPVRLPCFQSYADRETVCHSYASSESLQEAYEAKRHKFYLELQRKEEEIKKQFVQRVKEKAAMLKEAEQEVQTKFECLMLIHQEEELKLEEKKKVLEDEIAEFIEKKTTAELLQSQAPVSTPTVNLKRQGLQKNQDFQLELQCFDVRDEGTMNVQEQSERESEEEELEREIHPGNSRNSI
ncbi:septin-10 isoform X3 [Pipra filicauda]|uniref:Septin-10 isoform X3 n=1 Tax=Pipra filicauda TaxID=649802 RepID=A0A6J2IH14_9PASS|nr:septin-10 isoform X3 [Pipra filicauda]